MQRCYLVALGTGPINGLLNRTFGRSPTNNADRCILVSISLRFGKFFSSGLQLAEAFLHHCCMVLRLIIGMTMLVMFQARSYIRHRPRTRGGDWRNAACGIGITRIALFFRSNSRMSIAGMTVRRCSVRLLCPPLDTSLKLHRLEDAAIHALHTSAQRLVCQEKDRYLVAL